jgi:signal transduction histidine kinase
MKGYDRDWIISKGERRAVYTNLPPGDHVFEIIASNSDGVWTDVPKQFSFTVKPLFYQTGWFRVLALLALFGLIWLIVRWRTASTRERNIQLEKEVAKRTEELSRQKKELEQTLGSLKSTQAQLIHAEKMASLGELTAGIAHEIQNPLNFVNNFAELNTELNAEGRDALKSGNWEGAEEILMNILDNEQKILHHGKRADAIVKGMLQHSQKGSGTKEPANINNLVTEYLHLAYHGLKAKDKSFNAHLKTDLDPGIGSIDIIQQDIGRVLLNLFNNAFYAVSEKSKTAGPDYQPTVKVSTRKSSTGIEISVTDNGNGIPQSIKDKIFQPFFTTKPTGEGTGLGLSLSYDIVKAHGGNITVDSLHGQSTTFTIILPA